MMFTLKERLRIIFWKPSISSIAVSQSRAVKVRIGIIFYLQKFIVLSPNYETSIVFHALDLGS